MPILYSYIGPIRWFIYFYQRAPFGKSQKGLYVWKLRLSSSTDLKTAEFTTLEL